MNHYFNVIFTLSKSKGLSVIFPGRAFTKRSDDQKIIEYIFVRNREKARTKGT